MTTEIKHKIVSYRVITDNSDNEISREEIKTEVLYDKMHENIERPDFLLGSTYKIKTPSSEHALYVTINDIILNENTDYEERRPYEIFINSKNMEHFQWVIALTRLISAVFRKGGNVDFLVEELKAVFDPKGGYFKRGGVWMPSLVAEIGTVIEEHLNYIGVIKKEIMSEHQKQFLADKRKEFDYRFNNESSNDFPKQATLCNKCNTKAVIIMDGCMTCLNCGDSKCG